MAVMQQPVYFISLLKHFHAAAAAAVASAATFVLPAGSNEDYPQEGAGGGAPAEDSEQDLQFLHSGNLSQLLPELPLEHTVSDEELLQEWQTMCHGHEQQQQQHGHEQLQQQQQQARNEHTNPHKRGKERQTPGASANNSPPGNAPGCTCSVYVPDQVLALPAQLGMQQGSSCQAAATSLLCFDSSSCAVPSLRKNISMWLARICMLKRAQLAACCTLQVSCASHELCSPVTPCHVHTYYYCWAAILFCCAWCVAYPDAGPRKRVTRAKSHTDMATMAALAMKFTVHGLRSERE
jgi:hypothetical protein